MHKYVYLFKEGNASMRNLLGGKGAGLAEMTNIGVPIPQGFTITTEACTLYYDSGKTLPDYLIKEVYEAVKSIEKETGKKFGGDHNPLLVSVRSGARVSMPGMMETILNLGLNDETVEAMVKLTNNPRFCYDSYRRFLTMFGSVAWEMDRQKYFESEVEKVKEREGVKSDTEISAEGWKSLIPIYKNVIKEVTGKEFPQDPYVQLQEAIEAVFRSWNIPRAVAYRNMNKIDHNFGIAVNVQTMVFGNMGDDCATGVSFTRNPATGENKFYGEYLTNAQGEDVVAGIRTPKPIAELETEMPDLYKQYVDIAKKLELGYKDVQDMEFTIENGKLFMLQTRNGKRTAAAALKIACDLVDEGLIDEKEACLRVEPKALDALLHPTFDQAEIKKLTPIAVGLPASPGAATGALAFSAEEAKERAAAGEKVVLVRAETSPEDIEGMVSAQGILTMRGGMTSHAAVVARGMGKCCVAGCGAAHIDEHSKTMEIDGKVYGTSDIISIDGSTGNVYFGAVKTKEAELSGNFGRLMAWADKYRALAVRANADTPRDALQAFKFGAQGIGLCRTEHMFFEKDRIFHMRQMILADTVEEREKALACLLPIQRKDFYGLFMAMKDKNVNIRLLDPPLHEFLPQEESAIAELAEATGKSVEHIKTKINALHEFNPMMGHRGCRLDVSYPEIGRMQARAIIEAAIQAQKDLRAAGEDVVVHPEIMIPLTLDLKEFRFVKKIITTTADAVIAENHSDITYKVGTMIEIPRAALLAGEIASEAAYFSFGTNDLTQMTFGFSRDDAGKFLPDYYDNKIFDTDPFQTVDTKGVGKLIKMAVSEGRATNPDLHVGVCGEHGGDPDSIEFFHNAGLDYVSCSPFRVPVARLAAAQANIKNPKIGRASCRERV